MRKIHKRLVQLGANEFFKNGEADEQHEEGYEISHLVFCLKLMQGLSLDASFVTWLMDLRQHLLDHYPLSPGLEPLAESVLLQPKWLLHEVGKVSNGLSAPKVNGISTINHSIDVELVENRRLTPSTHWQDVRHMAFRSERKIAYVPGDVLTIYPQNNAEDVQLIIDLMQWSCMAEHLIQWDYADCPSYATPPVATLQESPLTLRQLLTRHLDLTAIPRRSFFSNIAHFTSDEFQKERLLEFTKPEYIDELFDYTTRPRRSILEVLQEFNTVKIPWRWAANVLPELRGRQFSIASGGQLKHDVKNCTRFELLVAIVKYKTVIKKMREGVCTKYLAGLKPGQALSVTLQKGGLGIKQEDMAKSILMVGPGTGVAPIRSILWETLHWSELFDATDDQEGVLRESGNNILVYGCRNAHADFFYRVEWDALKQRIPLEVYPAFSRDQPAKIYVQDIIRQQGSKIYQVLYHQRGLVFVCGSSGKMPIAVRTALAAVFRDHGSMSQDKAESYLETMEKQGRYKQETWG